MNIYLLPALTGSSLRTKSPDNRLIIPTYLDNITDGIHQHLCQSLKHTPFKQPYKNTDTMKATNYATLLIKSFEALRLNSYLCPAGKWTIGYGHTDGVNRGMLITEKTADAFLKQDIKHAEQAVNEVDADLT